MTKVKDEAKLRRKLERATQNYVRRGPHGDSPVDERARELLRALKHGEMPYPYGADGDSGMAP